MQSPRPRAAPTPPYTAAHFGFPTPGPTLQTTADTARELETAFMAGGGELGALIRAHDWARTSLGPPEHWPRSLKTVVRIMLTSRQPIWIGWGPELVYLYNDPYKSIIGGKHPEGLGLPTATRTK